MHQRFLVVAHVFAAHHEHVGVVEQAAGGGPGCRTHQPGGVEGAQPALRGDSDQRVGAAAVPVGRRVEFGGHRPQVQDGRVAPGGGNIGGRQQSRPPSEVHVARLTMVADRIRGSLG